MLNKMNLSAYFVIGLHLSSMTRFSDFGCGCR